MMPSFLNRPSRMMLLGMCSRGARGKHEQVIGTVGVVDASAPDDLAGVNGTSGDQTMKNWSLCVAMKIASRVKFWSGSSSRESNSRSAASRSSPWRWQRQTCVSRGSPVTAALPCHFPSALAPRRPAVSACPVRLRTFSHHVHVNAPSDPVDSSPAGELLDPPAVHIGTPEDASMP